MLDHLGEAPVTAFTSSVTLEEVIRLLSALFFLYVKWEFYIFRTEVNRLLLSSR